MNFIKKIYRYFYYRYLMSKDPTLFAKKIGVNLNGKVYLYGQNVGMFGSEPWLITLGKEVVIANNCQFINHDGAVLTLRHKIPDLELTFPINIGDNVFIGFGSIILPGVNIGDNVIIGAGSVVNKDIPANSVAAGVPCKVIKPIDEYEAYAVKNSLKFGHLKGAAKEVKLKEYYGIK